MTKRSKKPSATHAARNLSAWLAPVLLAAGQAVALLAIETQWFVFGSHRGSWVYPYIATAGAVDLMAAASLALIVTVGAWLALKSVESHEALTVVGALVGLTVVGVVLLNGSPNTLASLVQSDVVNGFYSAARNVDAARLLSAFDTTVQQYAPHVRTNLPGKVLFYAMLLQVSQRPDVLALIIAFVASLSAVVVYAIVRRLTTDRRAAFMAMVLVALTPSKVLFLPDLNVVSPLSVLLVLWMFVSALERESRTLAVCMGAWAFLAFLFEPLPFALGLVGIALLARHVALAGVRAQRTVQVVAAGVFGFAAAYAVFRVAFGFDLLAAFRFVLADAVKFNVAARRDYGIWVWQNLKEHLFGMGAAAALAFAWVGAKALQRPLFDRWAGGDGAMRAIAVGSVVTLVTLDLMGVNRGEVTRLWIFLTPLAQASVAYACRRQLGHAAYLVIVAGAVMQAALSATTVGFMIP